MMGRLSMSSLVPRLSLVERRERASAYEREPGDEAILCHEHSVDERVCCIISV